MQSASRLGLVPPVSTPSSFPSPSPSAAVQPRPALHLLPPHRRAHVLLQEMAGLTMRLLDLSGASKMWQAGLHKPIISPSLAAAAVPPEGLAATTAKEVLALIESHQTLLSEAVAEMSVLQGMEQEKERIREEIAAKDASMREFAKRVRDAEQVLEFTLEEFDEYRNPKRGGAGGGVGMGSLDVNELIAYARKISYTTFAPPDYLLGQPGALAPAPQQEQMRASQLYHFSDMEVPTEVSKPSTEAAPAAAAAQQGDRQQAAQAQAQAQAQGNLQGMEVPPMPPGWRPGDKIPTPVRTHVVPHVELELNPELASEGSDYYSDEDDEEQSSGDED